MPLHPQSKTFLEQLIANNAPAWHELPPAESRAIFSSFGGIFGQGPEVASVADTMLDTVPVRVYRPSLECDLPVILYFHGGGWVLGDLGTHDTLCRRLAHASGFVVAAVDYRLAPEHRYPAALDDCYLATQLISSRAEKYRIDATRLIVAGDSAGGNLAAAVSLKARNDQGPAIAGQVLIYPVIEPDFTSESYQAFATDFGLTRDTMAWFWQQYVAETSTDTRYAKLAHADVHRLPQAHVVTAEYDVLRAEGEQFAARLAAAGVPTTSKRYDGMLHGFIHFGAMFDDGVTAITDIAIAANNMVNHS